MKKINGITHPGKYKLLVFILLCIPGVTLAQCTTVDQSQLNYNGGMSARNLPQYSIWQEFTPGTSGQLCQIDVGFFNAMTGTGTLNIFSGAGTLGTLLQTQPVTVSGTGNFFQTFAVAVPVLAGSVYSFQFIPIQGGGLPDPYGVQVENPGTYPGGQMGLIDPSGIYYTGFDQVFRTYVTSSVGIESVNEPALEMQLFPNPFNTNTTLLLNHALLNGELIIYNSYGLVMKTYNQLHGAEIIIRGDGFQKGIYFFKVTQERRQVAKGKFVIID